MELPRGFERRRLDADPERPDFLAKRNDKRNQVGYAKDTSCHAHRKDGPAGSNPTQIDPAPDAINNASQKSETTRIMKPGGVRQQETSQAQPPHLPPRQPPAFQGHQTCEPGGCQMQIRPHRTITAPYKNP